MDKYIAIGRVSKTHGVDGALKLKIKDRYWEDFAETEVLFIESAGKVVPYFIEEFRGGQDPIVKFEDLNSRETAQALGGKEVLLRESDLLPHQPQAGVNQYERFVGYALLDQELGFVGEIESVIEVPGQYLALLNYQGREVSIPLNPVFVQSVDHAEKKVQVDLPEGLLELF
jgi:16S rRNA processing protein RimM